MPYPSVDALQKALGQQIFSNRTDVKKAAGRALGTIVELITFYMIKQWGFLDGLSIERGLAEFANEKITHNVEFGIHKCLTKNTKEIIFENIRLPLTTAKLRKAFEISKDVKIKSNTLLSSDLVLRNACVIGESPDKLYVAHLEDYSVIKSTISLSIIDINPFAMIECKRVGVEDGAKKGPTTIEKAKQGAYVAKHVSSLQKVRGHNGIIYGAWPLKDGGFEIRDLNEERKRLIYDVDADDLDGFILTVGIVSNHGNWFTSENMNKELLVLKDSYDWLLFLTDNAIAEFVYDTILSDEKSMAPVRQAFTNSYSSGESGKNQFTKVRIDYRADQVLAHYFTSKQKYIEANWFTILNPCQENIDVLKQDLHALSSKL
jgi:hypothetical protein